MSAVAQLTEEQTTQEVVEQQETVETQEQEVATQQKTVETQEQAVETQEMVDLSKYTIPMLKEQLKDRQEKLDGKKAELQERLIAVLEKEGYVVAPIVKKVKKEKKDSPKPKKDMRIPLRKALRSADLDLASVMELLLEVYGTTEDGTKTPISLPPPQDEEGLKRLKVVELRKILRSNNQKTSGKKTVLIERILHPKPSPPPLTTKEVKVDTGVTMPEEKSVGGVQNIKIPPVTYSLPPVDETLPKITNV